MSLESTVEQRERGYRAAAKIVDDALDSAGARRPKRCTVKMRKSAAYREGYWQGLLVAHCMSALGQFPTVEANANQIKDTLG